ncbi:MAG TPA: acyltransferase family protein, partial [Polyangiaceae bacterium]|nr:acyltransferase family protein [Polyangiaceae bacterium]
VLAWPGALLILAAAFGFGGVVPEKWTLALVVPAVLGACLMLFSGAAATPSAISRWFGQAIPRRIGQLSYSWYLWHWPFLVFTPVLFGDPTPLQTSLAVLASFLLAAVTYTLFENPIRHSVFLAAHPGHTLALGFIMVGGVAIAGMALDERGGEPTPAMKIAIKARGDRTSAHFDGCMAMYGTAEVKRCRYGKLGSKQRWILWGDSHAVQLLPPFKALADRVGAELTLYGKVACPPVQLPIYSSKQKRSYTDCRTWVTTVADEVEGSAPGTVVFLITLPAYIVETPQGELLNAVASKQQLGAGFRTTVERLMAKGLRVVSIRDTPRFEKDPARCLSVARGDATQCSFMRPPESQGPSWEKQVLGDLPGIGFIDINDHICETRFCPLVVNRIGVWRDDDHITATYARALTDPLWTQLQGLLSNPSPAPETH